ncbi:MAG: hypothetical protein HY905_02000 [Deltaproteobacteria bacterium]|nr:hypothetical protein [Deltaproteobacteria bacterium]
MVSIPPGPDPEADDAANVEEYAESCVRAVHRSLGLTLDYDPDTIPLLDHYLSLLADRPRTATRDPVRGLVAAITGAYFGEVVRRQYPSRWVAPAGSHPLDWRIEFTYWFLTFHPVAVAWEVILRRDVPDGGAGFLLDEATREQIAERLDALPGATVDDYFTFAQRLETLVLTTGWLAEREAREVERSGRPPAAVSAQRYARFLEQMKAED